jgi:trimeric autotransporter adhesin
MPEWFEALNRDFRYQLTPVGQFAQVMVASKMANNTFTIQTDKPNVEVSWQVTGIRHDAYAEAHSIPVEEEKKPDEKGRYLHPDLFGHAGQPSIGTPPFRHPQAQ